METLRSRGIPLDNPVLWTAHRETARQRLRQAAALLADNATSVRVMDAALSACAALCLAAPLEKDGGDAEGYL